MPYVYSTLTCGNIYSATDDSGAIIGHVAIKGGANVADRHFLTPSVVITQITENELELLKKSDAFKAHVDAGFISVRDKKAKKDSDVTRSMVPRDKSAPYTLQHPASPEPMRVTSGAKR